MSFVICLVSIQWKVESLNEARVENIVLIVSQRSFLR